MIGPLVNSAALAGGSLAGAALGDRIPVNLRTRMPVVFGLASVTLGVVTVVKVQYLPAVILAFLVGTITGELCHLETGITKLAGHARGFVDRLIPPPKTHLTHDQFISTFVALLVLFCISGMGIFGSMNEGMTGDPSLLIVKSILDLFTAAIFATALGYSVAVLALPQLVIQVSLFLLATRLLPLTTPAMIADFTACGGIIMIATGLRVAEIKPFAVANMLPSLFLVMPISALWARFMVPAASFKIH